MLQKIIIGLLIFLFSVSTCEAANLNGKTEIKDLRYSLGSGTLRIVLDVPKQVDYKESYAENPSRLIVSLKNTWINVKKMKKDIELKSTVAKRVKLAQFDSSTVRVVVETMADVKIFWLNGGPAGKRLVIDIGNATFKPNDELNKKQQEKEKSEPPPEENIQPDDNDNQNENLDDNYNNDNYNDDNYNDDNYNNDNYNDDNYNNDNYNDDNYNDDNYENEVEEPFNKDDKKEQERLEKERKEQEKLEKERLEKEKKEQEKLEKERKEREKQEKKEREKLEKEKKEQAKKDKKKNKDAEVDEPFNELDDEFNELLTLEGKIICIDAGHGGGDAGAIGPTGVTEKSVTLRVALRLQELLEEAGAQVILTRNTDKAVSRKGDKASAIEELQARCDVANKAKTEIFISIHADSFTNPAARGSTGYYYSKTEGTKAKRLADAIRRGVCEQLRTPSRGTQPCNFYVVRHTEMAATLIELAFISNVDEEKLLDSDEGIEKAAQGIFDGIQDYFG